MAARIRKHTAIMLLVCVVAGFIVVCALPSSPVTVRFVRLEPAGVWDATGVEQSLVALSVSNRSAYWMLISDADTRFQARLYGEWVDTEAVRTPISLRPHQVYEFQALISPDSEACQVRLKFRYVKKSMAEALGIGLWQAPSKTIFHAQVAARRISPGVYHAIWPTNAPRPKPWYSRPGTVQCPVIPLPGIRHSPTNALRSEEPKPRPQTI